MTQLQLTRNQRAVLGVLHYRRMTAKDITMHLNVDPHGKRWTTTQVRAILNRLAKRKIVEADRWVNENRWKMTTIAYTVWKEQFINASDSPASSSTS